MCVAGLNKMDRLLALPQRDLPVRHVAAGCPLSSCPFRPFFLFLFIEVAPKKSHG